jgi:hypothetical protein
MDIELIKKTHEDITKNKHFVRFSELTNKVRYFFEEERIDETIVATIQIPFNDEVPFATYTSSDKIGSWFDELVTTYRELFPDSITKTKKNIFDHPVSKDNIQRIILKGSITTDTQRILVKELIENGFDVFPDEDESTS